MRVLILLFALFLQGASGQAQMVNSGATIIIEAGGELAVEGDLTNQSGAINNNGKLLVRGDLTNTATLSSTVSTSEIIFTGTSPSVFTTGDVDLTNLTTTKTGADISLVGNLRLLTSLVFTEADGSNLNIDAANLTMAVDATVVDASSLGYVTTNGAGFMIKELDAAGSFTFPVGNASQPTALATNVTGTSFTAGNLKVKVNPTADPNLPVTVNDYLNRHWEVVADGITDYSNAVEASYLPADVTGQENLIEGASYANGEWDFTDAARTATSVTGTITGLNATFTGLNLVALPVELAVFSAEAAGAAAVQLSWTTDSELNTSHFTVERSTDALNWSPLARVNTAGTSNDLREYAYLDKDIPLQTRQVGTVYYRLDVVDLDGFREYSPIRNVGFDVEQGLHLYPNPTADLLYISTGAEVLTVAVFDELGKRVLTTKASQLNLRELPAGVYQVRVETGEGVQIERVIKAE